MHRNRSVSTHQFAMVPRADIPRSAFNMQRAYKTTFDSGYLIPVFCEEILPGDTFRVRMTAFARLATPIFPIMDNIYLDSFFFFVPNRLVWDNWQRFMGEQTQPGDSTSYVIPQMVSPVAGYAIGSLQDYFGLPTVGQVDGASTISHSALPLRAYAKIYDEWFRDENLATAFEIPIGDGPDSPALYGPTPQRRGKRHDYFTSCLPWAQKGPSVPLPLGTAAPVRSSGETFNMGAFGGVSGPMNIDATADGSPLVINYTGTATGPATWGTVGSPLTGLYADLSEATAATINALRTSFQVQRLLERDARGGTRYTEIVRSHFGVLSPDARLQRPEYLGGGSVPVTLNPIAQTSATDLDGGTTPLGNLAAVGTAIAHGHGFSQSFVEHGYVLGIVSVRADLTYQQGLRRHWSRSTRYDFYFPAFAMLGEQAVLLKEIFARGVAADNDVFGYQERWAEYRYSPSEITGLFRSTAAGTLDAWHVSQHFTSPPALNSAFITERPPLDRILAVGAAANGAQFIFDSFFDMKVVRPMPLYSVPGMIDHF